ncbi:MAG: hypothetical protein K0S71_593 [Clostridia bacterium]|jgi:hypothetical protein|nr:hypothetical protein [Clostridia bacterium]
MREKLFENKIKRYLSTLPNSYHYKIWGGGLQQAGIPDILACINGYFIAIEVKAEKGKPSPLQLREIKMINGAGGMAVILYPKDFETFKAKLEEFTGVHSVQ